MVKIQPMFMGDKTVSSVISSDDENEKQLKQIAEDNNLLKHWKFDYYEGRYKQTHHRFAFRTEEEKERFENEIRESNFYEAEQTNIKRPKVYRHKT